MAEVKIAQFIIATGPARLEGPLRKAVEEECAQLKLQYSVDYTIRPCENGRAISAAIDQAEVNGEAIFIICQPVLADGENAISAFRGFLNRKPTHVALLKHDDLPLLGIKADETLIIKDESEESLKLLKRRINRFLRTSLESGLKSYNRYSLLVNAHILFFLSPLADHKHVTDSERMEAQETLADFSEEARDLQMRQQKGEILSEQEIFEQWRALATEIRDQANKTRAEAAAQRDASQVASLRQAALALYRLWLEARLYSYRAQSNYFVYSQAHAALVTPSLRVPLKRIPPGFGISQDQRAAMRLRIQRAIQDYHSELRKADTKFRFLRRRVGDAEQFRLWSATFGPDAVNQDTEPGWDIHAASVHDLLRYKYRDARMRELWRDKRSWPAAFVLFSYKIGAGFGYYGGNTIAMTLIVFFASFDLEIIDDKLSGCVSGATPGDWAGVWQTAQYYFAVSASSLTNLGNAPTPCGLWHGFLMSGETVLGYFLLAVLTTLFVESLFDR